MIKVLKFNGTFLKDEQSIKEVMTIIKNNLKNKLVIVISSIGNYPDPYARDTLEMLVNNIDEQEKSRLISCSTIISSIILLDRIKKERIKSIALNIEQINLIDNNIIKDYFNDNDIVIIPSSMIIDNNVAILSKDDSDYTAIYLAKQLGLKEVAIYDDECGIYSGDPKYINQARLINHIDYNQALDLAYHNARIISYKALKLGDNIKDFKIYLCSFKNENIKTIIDYNKTNVRSMSIDFSYTLIKFKESINDEDYKYIYEKNSKYYFVLSYNLCKIKTNFMIIDNYIKVHFVGCGLDNDEIYHDFLDKFVLSSTKENDSYYVKEINRNTDLNLLHDLIVRCD